MVTIFLHTIDIYKLFCARSGVVFEYKCVLSTGALQVLHGLIS